MDAARLERLLDRYFDGGLCEADRAALERELLASAHARKLFWSHADMHWMLREVCGEEAGREYGESRERIQAAAAVEGEGVSRLRRLRRRRLVARKRTATPAYLRIAVTAAAACFLFAVGIWLATGPGSDNDRPIAKIQPLTGDVRLVRDGNVMSCRRRIDIQPGDELSVPEDSFARLKFSGEATGVRLAGGSHIQITGENGEKTIYLRSGKIACSVAAQKGDLSLSVVTDHAVTDVLGTVFSVAVDGGISRVEVVESRVRVTEVGTGRSVVVETGQYAEAGVNLALRTGSLAPAVAVAGDEPIPEPVRPAPEPLPAVEPPAPAPAPAVAPEPAPEPEPTFTLLDPLLNRRVRVLDDGEVIDLADTGSTIDIMVAFPGGEYRSARFELDGRPFGVESVLPFVLGGDRDEDYKGWNPATGSHTLVVTPFTKKDARGTAGPPAVLRFMVTDTRKKIADPVVTSFALIDAERDEVVAGHGAVRGDITIDARDLNAAAINFRADTEGFVACVVFVCRGPGGYRRTMVEDYPPFAAFGNGSTAAGMAIDAGDYNYWFETGRPEPGDYTLTATPYTQQDAQGRRGTALTITFHLKP